MFFIFQKKSILKTKKFPTFQLFLLLIFFLCLGVIYNLIAILILPHFYPRPTKSNRIYGKIVGKEFSIDFNFMNKIQNLKRKINNKGKPKKYVSKRLINGLKFIHQKKRISKYHKHTFLPHLSHILLLNIKYLRRFYV